MVVAVTFAIVIAALKFITAPFFAYSILLLFYVRSFTGISASSGCDVCYYGLPRPLTGIYFNAIAVSFTIEIVVIL